MSDWRYKYIARCVSVNASPSEWPINSNYGKETTITRLRGSILNPRTLYSRDSALPGCLHPPTPPTLYILAPHSFTLHLFFIFAYPLPSFTLRPPYVYRISDLSLVLTLRLIRFIPTKEISRPFLFLLHETRHVLGLHKDSATGNTLCFFAEEEEARYLWHRAVLIRIPRRRFIGGVSITLSLSLHHLIYSTLPPLP